MSCIACGGPEHEPEECPEAEQYWSLTNGACEHWFLTHEWEGFLLSRRLQLGLISEEQYYTELVDRVHLMHELSECGLPVGLQVEG